MLCELCKMRQAEGIVKTDEGSANLCAVCFQRYRMLKATEEIEGLMDFFSMHDVSNALSAYVMRNVEAVCPACGMSLSRLKNDFKFGCSNCYDFFSEKAKEYFEELGGQEYKGRYFGYENKNKPRKTLADMTVDDLPFLMKMLKEAKDNQELAKADAINRRIKQLKGDAQ
ncbi:MAG: hypothetical protein K2M75_06790 [Clostridia bacterium]|nr:hypothetical protein [Clostridia bacterium]